MSPLALLPTGTVTFLFTDIEGSTKLWENSPDVMQSALKRHDQILRHSIEGAGGYVFKTIGDAFCAAFPTASQALEAAIAAQLALAAEPWQLPTPLLVRMALHTGSAEERGGDYFGPPLNRVARLMAAGHGGQTLLSEVTQGLVRDTLPPGTSLRDLGERSLKDLGRPEQVYQLQHPALLADFPPLRSLDNPALPNNLPQQTTSFIGREKQVEEVKARLGKTRLLTLTGAGGSGKTRLSLQVAADLLTGDGDGVWLVELAALTDPALVPGTIASVLGIKEQTSQPIQQTLVEALRTKRLLIVLDNCEHLVAACASLAADLLRSCPDVHLLASSREPLNVSGEQTYRVPTLMLPDPRQPQTVESLSQFEAVRLFIERAQAVQPSFALTNANAPAVAQVCFRLDGIPLAIELAAARVRSLSAEEISRRLDHRFRLLTGGSRDTLPRQQTLRALIDWSYDLLTEPEKALLRRLSVFAGGWTLSAAEAVCADEPVEDWEVLDLLTALVDKSLVVAEPAGDGTRYRLSETVRQYSGDRLAESGEAMGGRAAACFLALAEEAAPQLTGPDQAAWFSRLEAEHDNLRASLAWKEQSADGREDSLRLAAALWRFWFVRGHLSEGRLWLDRALAAASGGEASAAWAKALQGAGNLAWSQGDYGGARALHEECLALFRQLGDQKGIASALGNLGLVASHQGDFAWAQTLHEECLALSRQSGEQQSIASALGNLGWVAQCQSDFAAARALYEECLTLFRHQGDQKGIANVLGNLGLVALYQGDHAGASALYEESLTLSRQLRDQKGIANALCNLGSMALYQGDYWGARALHDESLTLFRGLGDQQGIANALSNLGWVAQGQGDFAEAQALHEECLTVSRQLGDQQGVAAALGNLGIVAFYQDRCKEARGLQEECLALSRHLGDQQGIANALGNLGIVASYEDDYAGAYALHEECLALTSQLGDQQGIASVLGNLGTVAFRQGQMKRLVQFNGAAASLRESLGSPLPPVDQAERDKQLTSAAESLGEAAFAAAWETGWAMTLTEAIEYALAREGAE